MTGLKTNERPGTRAVLRHYQMSPTKARRVLDLIRDKDVGRAGEILRTVEREAAAVVSKVLASAVANAVHNDGLDVEDLYVSACFADEGPTAKRFRPRARGRAGRILKRTCHITVIVDRLPDERLARQRAVRAAGTDNRSQRVAESRRRADLAGRLSRRRHAQSEAEAQAALEAEGTAESAKEAAAEALATAGAEEETTDAAQAEGVAAGTDAEAEAATGAEDAAPEAEDKEEADEDVDADEEKGE